MATVPLGFSVSVPPSPKNSAATPQPLPNIEQLATASIPTRFGPFKVYVFQQVDAPKTGQSNDEHVALVLGDVSGAQGVLTRVHSECLTGEVFGSLRCDCRAQLERAQEAVTEQGAGVIVYLRQEGRGIGLANKIRAYALQDQGADTVDANELLHLPIDARDYGVAAAILKHLGVNSVRLMTNNPVKVAGLKALGVEVTERVGLVIPANEHSSSYLQTKRHKLQHDIPSSAHGSPSPAPIKK
ncbi:MAG TPA: GTP cyclohydrolase II [Polyangiaceae bacterium]|nr:GTP cyclohydrolase II [Polyangiaceae bacterium]